MSITRIQRWGNSSVVRLPKQVLQKAQLADNDKVEIVATEQGILIRKVKRYISLDQLFAGYKGDYQPEEWQTEPALGAEVID
ncbi:MAG: AbrB/MazE/SpoVT family DNA-binding domain-containing protein [Bacillota bacterium]|nr:AbrB/MazE/SpoVT family DNA-binding domain-containing protein [Bacillota bacterium]